MPTGIDSAVVMQFSADFDYAFQQSKPRLRRHTRIKTGVIGNQTEFPILGQSEMQDITGQIHTPTTWIDPMVTARWAQKQDKAHPIMLDWQSKPEILLDLEMGYAMNGAMAAARTADNIIATAVTATAYEGPVGATPRAFNTTSITPGTAAGTLGNLLAAGGTGLTVSKTRLARGVFDAREVGVDDRQNGIREAFVWIVTAGAMQQLLSETEAINKDYVQDAPLTEGCIIYFMGFTFVIYNNLVNTTGTTWRTLVWHRDAMGFALWKERELFVDRLPEHNNATGINYMCSSSLHPLPVMAERKPGELLEHLEGVCTTT